MPLLNRLRLLSLAAVLGFIPLAGLVHLPAQSPLPPVKVPGQPKTLSQPKPGRRAPVRPRLTGVGGVQTGVASFQGNFTQISVPNNTYFTLQRQPDCSLTYFNGTANGSGDLQITGDTPHFEDILHSWASLTTTPNVFSKGCATSNNGIGSRIGVWAGTTPQNIGVLAAAILYNGNLDEDALAIVDLDFANNQFHTTHDSSGALDNATAVTTADLNGDGIGDLVAVNANIATTATIDVLLGNADGTFQTPVSYAAPGAQTIAAVIDDVNGDGKLDVIVVSNPTAGAIFSPQQISVFLGNGDGTLQTPQSITAPPVAGYTNEYSAPIVNLITADLRGIGKKDIVCSNGLVLLGSGNGAFTALSTPAFPYVSDNLSSEGPNLAAADVNGDGKIDIVLDDSNTIATYLGKGDGTFTQGQAFASIGNSGYVTVADLDGDGNPDIYTGLANGGFFSGDDSSSNGYVLMGQGGGSFSGAPLVESGGFYTGNNLGDVNGDGVPDLITESLTPTSTPAPGFTVQMGTGKGVFNPVSTITAPASFVLSGTTYTGANTSGASTYAVGDINGDGKADLAFADNNLTAMGSGGGLPFQSPTPVYFTAISKGDGTFNAPVPYLFPQIAPAADYDISNSVGSLQIANLKKGGNPALIFTFNEVAGGTGVNAYNQGIVVLPGNGEGTFGDPIITSTYSSNTAPSSQSVPQIVSIADLNGDGNPDLLVYSTSFSIATGSVTTLEVFLGNGDGTFKTPVPVTTADNPFSLAVGDFNKDGKPDLAVFGQTPSVQGQLAISLGNGDGSFQAPAILNIDGYPAGAIAAADFNGDGNVDIAMICAEGFSGVFYGDGTGNFSSVNNGSASAPELVPTDLINLFVEGQAASAVDLNKDGKPDVLVGNTILLNLYGSAPATPAATTTALKTSATSITAGASVTLTATIAAASGSSGSPTGTVTFFNGTDPVGSVSVAAGAASLTTTALPAGTDSITAIYSGDLNFNGSASSAVSIKVAAGATPVATTTSLAASATTVTIGTSVTFTATVKPASGTAEPTGTVTFKDGTTTLGTGSVNGSGVASYTTSSLSVATHTITAVYSGDTNFSGSTSSAVTVMVNAAPVMIATSTALTASAASATSGTSITFTATVTPASGAVIPTGTVTFLDGTTTLGTGSLNGSGVATYTTSSLAVGAHSITASYGGATGFSGSTSAAFSVTITAPAASYTLALSPTSGSVASGSSATSTVTVTPSGGFNQQVSLTCSGAPANATCSVSPASVTPNGTAAATATLTIQTGVQTTALNRPAAPGEPHPSNRGLALAFMSGGGLLCFTLFRRRRGKAWYAQLCLMLFFFGVSAAIGCGGSSSGSGTNTPPGTYTITVTATAGSSSQTASYSLTVQ
jgi:hypothetical protein